MVSKTAKTKTRGRTKAKPVKKPIKPTVPLAALSVEAFCLSVGIGKNSFYKMLKAGVAPQTFRIGRRRIITIEASQEWQKAMQIAAQEAASSANQEIAI